MRALLDLVAPTRCVGCGSHADGELCVTCAQDVVVLHEPLCARCGAPRSATKRTCSCVSLEGFERARSLVAFAEPARALVLAIKRRGRAATVDGAGTLVAELARKHALSHEVVTFVPGGRAARDRGFDHAELLARSVARALSASVIRLLVRRKDGPRQADVGMHERRRNVEDRFSARPTDARILLVDDVFTTGATAEACALALRRAGAIKVDVVTWARTIRRL